MLDIKIICIGKLKEKFWQDAVSEYSKRLSAFCKFSIVELGEERQRNDSPAEIERVKNAEGEKILSEISGIAYTIALCIEGKQMPSESLSKTISEVALSGKSSVGFIIGGSYGLSDKVKKSVNLKLSFSEMTFPHQLFRVMLCEQIYRAFTIENGIKYHK